MSKLVILTGLPGSGKTTIGLELAKSNLTFIKIDDFYRRVPRTNESIEWHQDKDYITNVYKSFAKEIKTRLEGQENVVIESTGVSPRFDQLITNILLEFPSTEIHRIYLHIDPETARERVFKRNETSYPIKMSPESFDHFVSKTELIQKSYDFIIGADQPIEQIVAEIDIIIKD